MKCRYDYWLLLLLSCLTVLPSLAQDMLHRGEGVFTYDAYAPFADRPVDVHYYIPLKGDQADMPIIFVFQGADRGYKYLIEAWKQEAEAKNFMVFVPQFDQDKFPNCDYQEAGIMDKQHLHLKPLAETTPLLIDKMFEYVQQHTLTRQKTFRIFGHSGGGQFVQRFMLFHDSPYVDRAVIGSPGWYTFPDFTLDYPYGVKNVPQVTPERLRSYLSKDIIVQLATADTLRESFLRKTPEAEAQGRNRLERGHQFFKYLQTLSHRNNIPLRWRKVVVPDVAHNSVEMGMAAVPLLLEPSSVAYQTPSGNSGTCGLATLALMTEYFQALQRDYPGKLSVEVLGRTPAGNDIPVCFLGSSDADAMKVWIQGGLHGNEPAGPEVVALLTKYLLSTSEGNKLLEHLNICMVPVANPDGYMQQKRVSGSGYDLNRDMTKLSDPVTVLLKSKYLDWHPEAALDIHEYNPVKQELKTREGHQLTLLHDVLLLPSGHLNIPAPLRTFTNQKLFPALAATAEKMGYSCGSYFTPKLIGDTLLAIQNAKSPQSSSTWNGLSNAVSCFLEIRGIGMGKELFDKRVDCGFTLAKEFLCVLQSNQHEIKEVVQMARSMTCQGQADVHVVMQPAMRRQRFLFWDETEAQGVELMLPVQDAMDMEDVVVRKRPAAYLLDASCEQAVQKLRLLGVRVERLPRAKTMDVETYAVNAYSVSTKKWERIYPVTVTTQLKKIRKKFPAGTYVIPVNQEQGNLLVTLLEPESNNGFVNFGVIPIDPVHQTIPVFRK